MASTKTDRALEILAEPHTVGEFAAKFWSIAKRKELKDNGLPQAQSWLNSLVKAGSVVKVENRYQRKAA